MTTKRGETETGTTGVMGTGRRIIAAGIEAGARTGKGGGARAFVVRFLARGGGGCHWKVFMPGVKAVFFFRGRKVFGYQYYSTAVLVHLNCSLAGVRVEAHDRRCADMW